MSLRLRLLLMIGVSLATLWGASAAWMLGDLDRRVRETLDQRLAMSARMVAGLVSQNRAAWEASSVPGGVSTLTLPAPARGIACQVSSLRGSVLARTAEAQPDVLSNAAGGYSGVTMQGEGWRTYTLEIGGLRVTTADRLAERETLLREVLLAAALPFLVALLGGLAVLWFAVRRGLRPLEGLAADLDRREPESLAPVPLAGMPAELRPLVATLDRLFERVGLAIARERRFTSDAAHELRTPLTGLITNLQVARISHGAEASQAMGNALAGAARLRRTLEQLMTLSQVEGPFSWAGDGDGMAAGDIARQAVGDADALSRVVLRGDGERARLAMPGALAVIAVRNLLDNALRHSPSGAEVSLEVEADAGGILFRVCDRGPGMDEAQLAMATQRFWRRGPGPGSGLGLSIVSAIAERHGGSLSLARRPGGGLCAALRLPAEGSRRGDGPAGQRRP